MASWICSSIKGSICDVGTAAVSMGEGVGACAGLHGVRRHLVVAVVLFFLLDEFPGFRQRFEGSKDGGGLRRVPMGRQRAHGSR